MSEEADRWGFGEMHLVNTSINRIFIKNCRDRPAELSEISARTESFVTNIPPWNGPALSPRECSRSPLPSYRDESSLWRNGQRRIFNGPESLCPSAEMDNNRQWNREGWNVRDRSDDELRPRGNVSGDVMAWRQAEHWTSRERFADVSSLCLSEFGPLHVESRKVSILTAVAVTGRSFNFFPLHFKKLML